MTVPHPARLLIVTAVTAERDAAAAQLGAAPSLIRPYPSLTANTPAGRIDLVAGGVGAAAAAAATATALTSAAYDLVLSAGIAGAFAPIEPGATVVAAAVVHADLGAEGPDGFLPGDELGLGPVRTELAPRLVQLLATRAGASVGAILTVATVTGTADTAATLTQRHPDAVAEAMEGAGVLTAATAHGVPFAEIRTISNRVGPRDRSSWQLVPAFAALTAAIVAITSAPLEFS